MAHHPEWAGPRRGGRPGRARQVRRSLIVGSAEPRLLYHPPAREPGRVGCVKLSVLVPLYNEDATCVDLLTRVDAVTVEKEIIVVDDGSRVSMADQILAAVPSVRFFAHPQNRGKG